MKTLFFAFVALLATLFVGVSAEAGFFGESYLRAYNARIEVLKDDVWQKAEDGVDLNILFAFSTGTTSASLNGVSDGDTATTLPGSPNFSLNAPDANRGYVGSGTVVDNAGFPGGTGLVLGAGSPYSYSDVTAVPDGQLIKTTGVTQDSDVSVMVSALLDGNQQTAFGSSSVETTSQVQFIASQTAKYRLVFEYDLEQSMSLSAPPDSGFGSVQATYSVSGNSGGNSLGSEATFNLALGDASVSLVGQEFVSGELEVEEGNLATFGFSRGASLVMVPEPGTFAVFGLSALGVCFVGYRRRRNA